MTWNVGDVRITRVVEFVMLLYPKHRGTAQVPVSAAV
jgi:hypothetical protein